jgi:hypothetical protein
MNLAKIKLKKIGCLVWYQDFERDLINSGAISIDTERPIETVADDILSKI